LPEYGFVVNQIMPLRVQHKRYFDEYFELGFTLKWEKNLYAAMFLDSGYGTIIDQKQDESYLSYNQSSVTDRKANGLYSTDKDATIKPVAFGLTLGLNFK
jgi:hypothetical protein